MVEINTETELINQGSYGCIFRPGFTCDGKTLKNKKFITKVQKSKASSQKETNIGKMIKRIENYEDYFAPIIKTCEISLAKIDSDKIKRCDFIEEDTTNVYESNKLRYVGKNTIAKYMLSVMDTNPKQLIRVLLNTHRDLLLGFEKLFAADIVHMDVKENNIMMEDTTGNPIIIDFGLSADIKKLDNDEYRDVFFVYGPDYAPWCIDICMLSYMANELENEIVPPGMFGFMGFDKKKETSWKEGIITKQHITKVINDFIKKNNAMTELFNESQRNEYNTKLQDYFGPFVGKRWLELSEFLLKNVSNWDSYAVSIMYLYLIKDFELNKLDITAPNWKSYKTLLEKMVLSPPNERKNSTDMIKSINALFKTISSNENAKLMRVLNDISLDKDKKEMLSRNVLTTIQNNLRRESKIYEKIK